MLEKVEIYVSLTGQRAKPEPCPRLKLDEPDVFEQTPNVPEDFFADVVGGTTATTMTSEGATFRATLLAAALLIEQFRELLNVFEQIFKGVKDIADVCQT
jgi:hypothetical protein